MLFSFVARLILDVCQSLDILATFKDLAGSACSEVLHLMCLKLLDGLSFINVRFGITDRDIFVTVIVGISICTMSKFFGCGNTSSSSVSIILVLYELTLLEFCFLCR